MRSLFLILALSLFLNSCANSDSPAGSVPAGTTTFTVTSTNAPVSYTVNGSENPTITLQRGQTYTFDLTVPGHPFYIMTTQGTNTGNAYSNGITGNGTVNGTLTFAVPSNAPNTLFYDCSVHAGMTGTITVTN